MQLPSGYTESLGTGGRRALATPPEGHLYSDFLRSESGVVKKKAKPMPRPSAIHEPGGDLYPEIPRTPDVRLQGLRLECVARGNPLLRTILLIVIVLALLGSLPVFPYSTGWGYYPSGGLGLILIILIVLILLDRRAV
jgi:hypothetical protein